ncbi:AMP-binding protein [Mycolicibacterium sp.]|jgi:long-chain acyl-CoA synthetase|uniref:AMP-binding protein n=1 Tax=Mycolicibacterium sp. TaxID=2320850 RepID=UPI0028A9D8EB|nr:AMP-binding protein [Mycolicibacterium sp.]
MHLAALPDERAARNPGALALPGQHSGALTNAQVLERVEIAAGHLARAGVGAGDVVAVKLHNQPELIIALFAAWRLGAAATPINTTLTATEVEYQLGDSSASVLVCEQDSAPIAGTTVVPFAVLSDAAGPPPATEKVDFCADDLALLIYTAGTTGWPKVVELTHSNVMEMAQSMLLAMTLGQAPNAY